MGDLLEAGILWGAGIAEYRACFALEERVLRGKILESGCGPTAFNSEQHAQGRHVLSLDPLFTRSPEVLARMLSGTGVRKAGMEQFLADYPIGFQQGRYAGMESMPVPGSDFGWDIALMSHVLQDDAGQGDLQLWVTHIRKLARVAREVRLYPLTNSKGSPTPVLGPLLLALQQEDYGAEVREVHGMTDAGKGAMLRVFAHSCRLPGEQ